MTGLAKTERGTTGLAMTRLALNGLARRALVAAGAMILGIGVAIAQPATVTTDLNLRAGPGTNYRVVATMPQGSRVDILECRANWCRVDWRGRPGWASARFLDVAPQRVRPEPPRAAPFPIPIPIPGFTPPRRDRDRFARCRAERADFIVGSRATERRLEQALDASRARTLRVERPDRFYTQEFRPDRLTVVVDRRNVVRDVVCR